jgi:hypothetical protein
VFTGAVLVAAPLAALTLTPAASTDRKPAKAIEPYYAPKDVPTDLPSIIASGVSTSVQTAVAAARTVAQSDVDVETAADRAEAVREAARERAQEIREQARDAARETRDSAREARRSDPIRRVIEAKAVGLTPEYIAAMRASAPRLTNLQFSDFTGLRAVGVTPEFARGLVAAGFPSITADELMEARAVGVTGGYVNAMRSAGVRGDLDDFVQLRAVGVDPEFAARVKASGIRVISADDLVQLRALGITRVPAPPHAPVPPRPTSRKGLPAASPPNWNSPDSDPGG